MENFFIEDTFISDFDDLMDHFDIDEEKLHEVEEDWSCEIFLTDLEPVFVLDADWITEKIDEERLGEDGHVIEKVEKSLLQSIDFEKVNAAIPKFYYPNGKSHTLTKKDLINYVDNPNVAPK